MKTVKDYYLEYRKPQFVPWCYGNRVNPMVTPAHIAIMQAKHKVESNELWKWFTDVGGEVVDEYDFARWKTYSNSPAAIICSPCDSTVEDLEGDAFNPDANPEVKKEILDKERKEFIERLAREGVYYYQAMALINGKWEECDSIGGIVGDEFIGCGYDSDLIRSIKERIESFEDEVEQLEQFANELP